jgi:hypothetical protein
MCALNVILSTVAATSRGSLNEQQSPFAGIQACYFELRPVTTHLVYDMSDR